jgi:hypothetical protein
MDANPIPFAALYTKSFTTKDAKDTKESLTAKDTKDAKDICLVNGQDYNLATRDPRLTAVKWTGLRNLCISQRMLGWYVERE